MVATAPVERIDSSTANDPSWVLTDPSGTDIDREILSGGEVQPQIRVVAQKIEELFDLPENWDSYGARRIDPDCASFALDLLHQTLRENTPAPHIVPTTDGGIQIEWHTKQVTLELEVLSSTRVLLYFEGENDTVIEAELRYDFNQLTRLLATLSAAI